MLDKPPQLRGTQVCRLCWSSTTNGLSSPFNTVGESAPTCLNPTSLLLTRQPPMIMDSRTNNFLFWRRIPRASIFPMRGSIPLRSSFKERESLASLGMVHFGPMPSGTNPIPQMDCFNSRASNSCRGFSHGDFSVQNSSSPRSRRVRTKKTRWGELNLKLQADESEVLVACGEGTQIRGVESGVLAVLCPQPR